MLLHIFSPKDHLKIYFKVERGRETWKFYSYYSATRWLCLGRLAFFITPMFPICMFFTLYTLNHCLPISLWCHSVQKFRRTLTGSQETRLDVALRRNWLAFLKEVSACWESQGFLESSIQVCTMVNVYYLGLKNSSSLSLQLDSFPILNVDAASNI